jgi:N-acyl-D-amino-acid deacylase
MLHDLLIAGGLVIDGTGRRAYRGDVAVSDGRIAAVGQMDSTPSKRAICVDGCVVCPGFVDVHTHSDLLLFSNPRHEAKVCQGVTTEIVGQDGMSYVPASPSTQQVMHEQMGALDGNLDPDWHCVTVAEYLRRLDGHAAVNVAYLLPHLTMRVEVMGLATRPASGHEIATMQQLVAQGMADGAVGLSTGLNYWPANFATTDELTALCRPLAAYHGVYVTHLRDYRDRIVEAMEEAISIGEQAGVAVHISHLNHRADVVTPVLDSALARGVDVTFDLYPYLAGCTLLTQALPAWTRTGSVAKTAAFLRQPSTRDRLKAEFAAWGQDWSHVLISSVCTAANKHYEGQRLSEAVTLTGKSLPDFIIDLLLDEDLQVLVVQFHTHRTEEDVRRLMRHSAQMFGSDSLLGGHPHPRAYGTFPRTLGTYVRDLHVLTLEEAIRKMTYVPARRFGLLDRGLLQPGLAADIVVFDPDTIADKATYQHPHQFPTGIEYVVVNGELVVDAGQHTGKTPGRSLRSSLQTGA